MKKIIWEKCTESLNSDELQINKSVIQTPINIILNRTIAGNFWFGDANFDIDTVHYNIINNVPGVDIIHSWSPYQFIIGIGKAFDYKKVLKNIELAVGCYKPKNKLALTSEQRSKIHQAKKDISQHKFWAIYILPNGEFESVGANNSKDFLPTYEFFHNLARFVGGRLLSPTRDKMVY